MDSLTNPFGILTTGRNVSTFGLPVICPVVVPTADPPSTETLDRFKEAVSHLGPKSAQKLALHLQTNAHLLRGSEAIVEFFTDELRDTDVQRRVNGLLLRHRHVKALWTLPWMDIPELAPLVSRLTAVDFPAWNTEPRLAAHSITIDNSVESNRQKIYDLLPVVGHQAFPFFLARFPEIGYLEDEWHSTEIFVDRHHIEDLGARGRQSTLLAILVVLGISPHGPRSWKTRAEASTAILSAWDKDRYQQRAFMQALLLDLFMQSRRPDLEALDEMKAQMLAKGVFFDWTGHPQLFTASEMFAGDFGELLRAEHNRPAFAMVYAIAMRQLCTLYPPPDWMVRPPSGDTSSGDDASSESGSASTSSSTSPDSEPRRTTRRTASRQPATSSIQPASSSSQQPAEAPPAPDLPLARSALEGLSLDTLKRLVQSQGLFEPIAKKRATRALFIGVLVEHFSQQGDPTSMGNLADAIAALDRQDAAPSLAPATTSGRNRTSDHALQARDKMETLFSTAHLHHIFAIASEKPLSDVHNVTRDAVIANLLARASNRRTEGWNALRELLETPEPPAPSAAPAVTSRPDAVPKRPIAKKGGGRRRNHRTSQEEETRG